MTTKEAAKLLGIAQESVSRLIKRGELKATKFGYAWMIDRNSAEEYLKRIEGKSKYDPTRGKTKK
ncbi:MAG: helix-turn-helix domain-containing protein [Anaerolineae bacterium]|nr:helix-turn-helix domain-containing protein [Anaerolineae bacterium]